MANPIESAISFISDPFGGASALSNSVGKVLGLDNNDAIDKSQETLRSIQNRANAVSAQNKGLYGDYWNQMQGMYGDNAGKYNDAVSQLADAISNREDFSYDRDRSEERR